MSAAEARRLHAPQALPGDPHVELESVDCPVCGADDAQTVIFASDPTTGIGGRFRVVRCTECRFAYTNPRPTPASIGLFYPDDYQPYQDRPWDHGRRARWQRSLESAVLRTYFGYPSEPIGFKTRLMANYGLWRIRRSRQRQSWIPFRRPGRLLDFGCGAGNFLREMQHFGWQVQGLDFSEPVARDAAARLGVPVHVGTLPHPAVKPQSFDAVTMWNALEHVHQPRETVRSAVEALRPGGILVVGVPNFDSWGFEKFQHEWHGLELPRHLNHFTPETLTDCLTREGCQVLSVNQISRVGWMRRSARRAAASGWGSKWLHRLKHKPLGIRVSDWSERIGRADFIRAIAERR